MNGDENTLEFGGNHFGNKRMKEMTIDRFGDLPDSLIIHILSFLNVKEAAITSMLSKRWEFLWTDLPRLEFRAELPRGNHLRGNTEFDKVRKFVSWVNRTLAIRTTNYLEKFDVSLIYHKCFTSDVDAWVHFAVENKVKTLNLLMRCWTHCYTLPQFMYSCSSLTTLHVTGCIMNSKRTIQWQSLTQLHLHEVDVDQRSLDEILSSCPVLYKIYLERCWGFDHLVVNSPSVRSLSIVDSEDESTPPLKISAPYIHSLYISLLMEGRKLQLGNISSLVRADIDYEGFSLASVELMNGAKKLLESLEHVKELHVGLRFIEVVSMMTVKKWQLPQSRRELLVIASASEYEHIISGIIGLLESSPNLETLVIEGCATEGEDVILEPAAKDDLASDLLHLKTIKVRNFADSRGEPILTLARILLKRATALEEMVIMTDVKDEKMVQAMLTYPRSSTTAVVRFVK